MDKYFRSLIYDYQKRKQMREHPVFKKINATLETEKTGNLGYLMRQAHENAVQKSPNAIVKLGEWTTFYFASGEKRKTVDNTYQSKQYYGRTEEELLAESEKLMKVVNTSGNSINLNAAANIVYIKTIDEPYLEYMRCCYAMFYLKKNNPNYEFELSKALDATEYSVDIMVKKNGKLISAIKVIDESEIEYTVKYNQKHSVFKMVWGCDVTFISCSVNGNIGSKIPSFIE